MPTARVATLIFNGSLNWILFSLDRCIADSLMCLAEHSKTSTGPF